jgi:hypothetical protein
MTAPRLLAAAALALACGGRALHAQQPVHVAPNAPADRQLSATRACQWDAARRAMAPYVARARASYPEARERFRAGLPARHTFFVTTRLRDERGREEQVFVAVEGIVDGQVVGRIWSRVFVVEGYRLRQPYAFPESELVDWMVARPDGTEEGNVVGKFLDTYTPPARCAETAAG